MDYTKNIQDIAVRLFAEEKIDVFVGYKLNENDGKQIPFVFKKPAETSGLIFNKKSAFNLCNYLTTEHTKNKRVGIVVKGCDSRSLNMLLTENQVKRQNLYIIGIACEGIENEKGELQKNCANCIMPDAVIYDEILGTPKGKQAYKIDEDVLNLRSLGVEEKAATFDEIFETCIRCNACRQSCPLCYCEKCVIDQETSVYHNGAATKASAAAALTTWYLHLAGRCVDCRNCERACPRNLPLHLIHKQNEAVIYENFQNHVSGMEEGDRGAFYKYNMNDPDKFIL